jgi:hypothetical protein
MKHKNFLIKRLLILSAVALLAAGCGGSDSSNSDSSGQGVLALRITDAPVNDADIAEVWVRFTQVIIHPADGRDNIVHDVEDDSDPNNVLPYREIELKSLVGGKTSLLGDIPLDAGEYSWIRLVIDPENTRIVETSGAEYLVKCPSCDKSGFKLVRAFDVEATGWVDFTIDFDLRKSLTLRRPNKVRADFDYILRPTLRILDTFTAWSKTSIRRSTRTSAGYTCTRAMRYPPSRMTSASIRAPTSARRPTGHCWRRRFSLIALAVCIPTTPAASSRAPIPPHWCARLMTRKSTTTWCSCKSQRFRQ